MATTPGLFIHPYLTITNIFGVPINSDNDGDGVPTPRLLPYASVSFIILLDALFEEYANGRTLMDDQAAIYRNVEDRIGANFGLDGRACLQRFICELTKNPIRDRTMVGELVTVMFSPRDDGSRIMEPYRDAKMAGEVEHPESCYISYANYCPISIFNHFNNPDYNYADNQFTNYQKPQPDLYDPLAGY